MEHLTFGETVAVFGPLSLALLSYLWWIMKRRDDDEE